MGACRVDAFVALGDHLQGYLRRPYCSPCFGMGFICWLHPIFSALAAEHSCTSRCLWRGGYAQPTTAAICWLVTYRTVRPRRTRADSHHGRCFRRGVGCLDRPDESGPRTPSGFGSRFPSLSYPLLA